MTTCHVNRNTEAPCRVSGNSERKHFAGSYETVSCDRPLFEFCWTVIFISPLFIFNRKTSRGKPCGCLSSASSEDCRNHEPLSVSARFFCLSASKLFSSCSDSQAPPLLSPMNSFLFYLSPFAFYFLTQKDNKDLLLRPKIKRCLRDWISWIKIFSRKQSPSVVTFVDML